MELTRVSCVFRLLNTLRVFCKESLRYLANLSASRAQATRLVRRMGKARPKAAGKAKGAGGGVPGGAVLAATLAVAAAVAVGLLFPWGALTAPEAAQQQKAAQQKV